MLILDQIDHNLSQMTALVKSFANINSHSKNLEGIEKLMEKVQLAFSSLQPDEMRVIPLQKNPGLFLQKRKQAPIQIYFGGHLDTVFPKQSAFQTVSWIDYQTLNGPGVTDMKGGLVIMLKGLEAFEKTEYAPKIGWKIFLNSDEEIGSIYSTPFIKECSQGCDFGCIFEPPLPTGSMVNARKGSRSYTIYSSGIKGHAGRDAKIAENAIYPLARFVTEIEHLNQPEEDCIVNVGIFQGGEAKNIIPDAAECHLNVRAFAHETLVSTENTLLECAKKHHLRLEKHSDRPPKPFDEATKRLFNTLKECGSQLGLDITWEMTGGVCDGNNLASYGIPTIDTLGVNGGMIHTEKEFMFTKSLCEKAKLLVLFLSRIAS